MITAPTVHLIARPQIDWIALTRFLFANEKPSVDESLRASSVMREDHGLAIVEAAARICYDSYGKGRTDIEEFVVNLLKHKDGSVLEHVNYTFAVSGISRSLSHELVRHRAGFAYSQRSQRFVDESGVEFVVPPLLLEEGMESMLSAFEAETDWIGAAYSGMVSGIDAYVKDEAYPRPTERRKAVRSTARSILPNAAETKMIVTGNVRAWRHFLEMRASAYADAEIRRLALRIFEILQRESPLLFFDINYISESEGVSVLYSKV